MWQSSLTQPLFGVWMLLAGAPCAAPEEVQVTVVAILASDQHKNVDKKVECIAREVKKIEEKLTGYGLGIMTCKPVTVGAAEKFPLVEDETVSVVVIHGPNKENRVRLKVKAPMVGEITYTTCCGKCFPIVTPYLTKKGDRLIVAVMVEPCKDKK